MEFCLGLDKNEHHKSKGSVLQCGSLKENGGINSGMVVRSRRNTNWYLKQTSESFAKDCSN